MKSLAKKTSIILTICVLILSTFLLSACGSKQITIEQIYDKLSSGSAYVDEYTWDAEKISEQKLEWTYEMEKQNIDSEHLMVVAVFNYSSKRINILKFSKDKYAKKMIENYNFENDVKAKRYGNLIVVADNQIQYEVFKVINSIK